MATEPHVEWHRIDVGGLAVGRVKQEIVAGRAVVITRTENGYASLDNRCPHQGGPLGEGHIDDRGWLICPWHGYEYDPIDGSPPDGYGDHATAFALDERDDGLYVGIPVIERTVTLMDQMVDVMTDWGVDSVFGMVGHSNLGLGQALQKAEEDGRLSYYGVRHEGAAAFAASAYAKLTGRPAACFSIAGPGATNLLTGLWDAKVDRVPILALTGQVNTQVLGPGAFQEVPLAEAFSAVAEWSQTILGAESATELMSLALKHAIVQRDVAHLIFPDDMGELPGRDDPPPRPRDGRISAQEIAPPRAELSRAIEMIAGAERPGDHPRQRSPILPQPDHRTRREDRRAADHDVQGKGRRGRRPSSWMRRPGTLGHADCLEVDGPRRRPAGFRGVVFQPHRDL